MFTVQSEPIILPLLPSVMSTECCKRLQKEKEEMRTSFEGAVQSLECQHKEELVLLENRYHPQNQKRVAMPHRPGFKCHLLSVSD